MRLEIDEELLHLVKKIQETNLSEDQWAEIESSDMFQSKHYCGGFDADENEFCFSFFTEERGEYWFGITLEDVEKIVDAEKLYVDARVADL